MKKKCPVCLCLVSSSATTCNFCKTPLKISNSIQKTEVNKSTFTPPVVVFDKKITNTSTKMTPDMINMINTQYKNITGENERALEIKNSTKPLVEEKTNNHSFLEIETGKNDNHSTNSFVEEKKVKNNSGFLRFEDIPIIKEKNSNSEEKNPFQYLDNSVLKTNEPKPKNRNTSDLENKKPAARFDDIETPLKNFKMENKAEEMEAKKASKFINFDRIINQMKVLEETNQIKNQVTSDMLGIKPKNIMQDTFDVRLDALGFIDEELDFKELKKHVKASLVRETEPKETQEEKAKRKFEEEKQRYFEKLKRILKERKNKLVLRISSLSPFYIEPFEIENLEFEEMFDYFEKNDNLENEDEINNISEENNLNIVETEINTEKQEEIINKNDENIDNYNTDDDNVEELFNLSDSDEIKFGTPLEEDENPFLTEEEITSIPEINSNENNFMDEDIINNLEVSHENEINNEINVYTEDDTINIFKPIDMSSLFQTTPLNDFIEKTEVIDNSFLIPQKEDENIIENNNSNIDKKEDKVNNIDINNNINPELESNPNNDEYVDNQILDNEIRNVDLNTFNDNILVETEPNSNNEEAEIEIFDNEIRNVDLNTFNNNIFVEKNEDSNKEKEVIEKIEPNLFNKNENFIENKAEIKESESANEPDDFKELVKNRLKRFSKKNTENKEEIKNEKIEIKDEIKEEVKPEIKEIKIFQEFVNEKLETKVDPQINNMILRHEDSLASKVESSKIEKTIAKNTSNDKNGAKGSINSYAVEHFTKAKELCIKNNYLLALKELEFAVKFDPTFEQAHILLSRTFLKLKSTNIIKVDYDK